MQAAFGVYDCRFHLQDGFVKILKTKLTNWAVAVVVAASFWAVVGERLPAAVGDLTGANSRREVSLGQTDLVTEGKSDWKIILRPNATGPETLAAQELAKYIRAITQAELPIINAASPGPHEIMVDSAEGGRDGFDLTVTRDRITIHGHTPRGALYGAYQLLEDLGCRWYYIGQLGEVVPMAASLRLPHQTTTQSASFRERSVMVAYPFYYDRFEEWIDFLAKRRINNLVIYGQSLDWWKSTRARYLPLLQARNMILEFGGHILPNFVPRQLFELHPEYFRMNEKGERVKEHNFCPNSGALEVLKNGVREYFAQLPEITYFHVWADDLTDGGWCRCPKCRALSPADQNLIAMNAVAEVLAPVNPQASLALLTYHDTGKPPNGAPATNLFLFHAPRERCYRHAFNDPACRRNREEYGPDWQDLHALFSKTAPRTIHEFGYYTDGLLDREMQPPQLETIPADARYFRSLGVPVHQNLMVCFRDWRSPPFSLVLFAQSAWDADVNADAALENFCRQYYGAASAGTMTDYYRKVDEACARLFSGDPITGPYIDMTWPPLEPAMRKAKIADAQAAKKIHQALPAQLEQALKAAPAGRFAERLRREREVCELHQLSLELACCQFEGQFLGWQCVGGSGKADGLRAVELLTEGCAWADKIIAWAGRFPEEQKNYLPGWESYWSSYSKVFTDLQKRVREKLSNEK